MMPHCTFWLIIRCLLLVKHSFKDNKRLVFGSLCVCVCVCLMMIEKVLQTILLQGACEVMKRSLSTRAQRQRRWIAWKEASISL